MYYVYTYIYIYNYSSTPAAPGAPAACVECCSRYELRRAPSFRVGAHFSHSSPAPLTERARACSVYGLLTVTSTTYVSRIGKKKTLICQLHGLHLT